jgi:hypothetical protein
MSFVNLADQFGRGREKECREWIGQNDVMANGLATRFTRGDQFESLLGEEFTNECRDKLKVIVKDNVAKERKLKAYMNAVKSLKDNYSPPTSQQENDENGDDIKPQVEEEDFQQKLEENYTKELEKIENNSIMVTQENRYLKLLEKLGEQDDQDDELVVVNPASSDNSNRIKCHLTLAVMEDPVRSRTCKHSFSRAAIVNHLRRSKICPVAGCINNNMTTSELEDDPDTVMLVRRYKKREELQKKNKAQSALDMDDDDDDE